MGALRQTYAPIEKSMFGTYALHTNHMEKMCWEVLPFLFCPLMLNVLFNPDIPDSLSYTRMLPWTQAGVFQLYHLAHPVTRVLLSLSDLQSKLQIPKSLFYSYLQIKYFLSVRSPGLSLAKPTSFKLLCTQDPYEHHLITSIYNSPRGYHLERL